jgi:hypothetical protein
MKKKEQNEKKFYIQYSLLILDHVVLPIPYVALCNECRMNISLLVHI